MGRLSYRAQIQGTQFTVDNNNFSATTSTGTIGVQIANGYAQGGSVNNNLFNGLSIGVYALASHAYSTKLVSNKFVGNTQIIQLAPRQREP